MVRSHHHRDTVAPPVGSVVLSILGLAVEGTVVDGETADFLTDTAKQVLTRTIRVSTQQEVGERKAVYLISDGMITVLKQIIHLSIQ